MAKRKKSQALRYIVRVSTYTDNVRKKSLGAKERYVTKVRKGGYVSQLDRMKHRIKTRAYVVKDVEDLRRIALKHVKGKIGRDSTRTVNVQAFKGKTGRKLYIRKGGESTKAFRMKNVSAKQKVTDRVNEFERIYRELFFAVQDEIFSPTVLTHLKSKKKKTRKARTTRKGKTHGKGKGKLPLRRARH